MGSDRRRSSSAARTAPSAIRTGVACVLAGETVIFESWALLILLAVFATVSASAGRTKLYRAQVPALAATFVRLFSVKPAGLDR